MVHLILVLSYSAWRSRDLAHFVQQQILKMEDEGRQSHRKQQLFEK